MQKENENESGICKNAGVFERLYIDDEDTSEDTLEKTANGKEFINEDDS